MTRISGRAAAAALLVARYDGAKVMFVGGSAALGTETEHSDLDLTVVYDQLPNPIRESFLFEGWPVESSMTDVATLRRAIAFAPHLGTRAVPGLVAEALVLPDESELSRSLQHHAREVIAAGPLALSPSDHQAARYGITYTLHKLSHGPAQDLVFVGANMLLRLVNYWLRSQGKWAASNTYVGRRLREEDPAMATRMLEVFTAMHAGELGPLNALIDDILAPFGGRLFDGYRDVLPPTERRARELG